MEKVVDQRAENGIRYMFSAVSQPLFPGAFVGLCHQRNKSWDKRVAVLCREVSVSCWRQHLAGKRTYRQSTIQPPSHRGTGIDDGMLRHNTQLGKMQKASCCWTEDALILLHPPNSTTMRITSASPDNELTHDLAKVVPGRIARAAGSTHGLVCVEHGGGGSVPDPKIAFNCDWPHTATADGVLSVIPSPGAREAPCPTSTVHGRVDSVRRRPASSLAKVLLLSFFF